MERETENSNEPQVFLSLTKNTRYPGKIIIQNRATESRIKGKGTTKTKRERERESNSESHFKHFSV